MANEKFIDLNIEGVNTSFQTINSLRSYLRFNYIYDIILIFRIVLKSWNLCLNLGTDKYSLHPQIFTLQKVEVPSANLK